MPTYEYKCEACGHTFERFQSITAAPIKRCPECGKSKVRRLIGTGAGLIFKGSGFYITDYRDGSYKEKAKAEAGGGESKNDSKADSKSEPKTDAKPAAETKSVPKPNTETKSETKSESKPAEKKTESKPAAKSESKPKKK